MSKWRKASHSNQESACVEVHGSLDRLRDSKNPQAVLTVDVRALVARLRQRL
jgi:Domain of unknown function (DUF397)